MNSKPPQVKHAPSGLAWLEIAIWVLIYGGLLAMVLGGFVQHTQGEDASLLYGAGGLALLAGVGLIYLRSRLQNDK